MKAKNLEFNLRLSGAFLDKAIDDIALVYEHLYFLKLENPNYDMEIDFLADEIKHHASILKIKKRELFDNIDRWCEDETQKN